jgi:biopolymer transport protein ExbD
MAFGAFGRSNAPAPMAEINMIPLIDVMLVLLVIFIITAPLLTHAVRIDLPKASSGPVPAASPPIVLSLDADGSLYWNDERVAVEAVRTRLAQAGTREPQPELHLRADRATRYERIAEVMADASTAGIRRIGFVSDPRSIQRQPASRSPRAGTPARPPD